VPYLRKNRGSLCRGSSVIGFFAPWLLAFSVWLALPGSGLAQVSSSDPRALLQSGGNGLGGLLGIPNNGLIDTTSPLQQSQTFQPQNFAPAASLPPSRLEQIMSARAGVKLTQFGYDQLGQGGSVTISQTGAVQDDYMLGPGDQITVSLRGQENSDIRASVDRNGQVILPRLKPIAAAGRSFGSFRQDVEAAVHRAYVATDASVSVGTVRQISVLVSGEVNNPGQRALSGLSSVVDALLLSGGVRKTGSLRNVRIQRAGHEYVADLYSVLTARGGGAQLRLADGDRILVPPLGRTVAVSGLVRRPGIYELASGQRSIPVRTLLELGGGQEVRGRFRVSVLRVTDSGQTAMEPLTPETGAVRDSEILFVQLGADQATSQATLSGASGLAGQYAIRPGMKLSEILRAPGALGNAPYSLFGIIVRRDPRSYLRVPLAFAPVSVLTGRTDQPLQTDDVVRVLSVNEERLLTYITRVYLGKLASDQNNLRNPLESADDQSQTQTDAPVAGEEQLGLDQAASAPADIQRDDITALLDTAAPGSTLDRQRKQAKLNQAPPAFNQPGAQVMGSAVSQQAQPGLQAGTGLTGGAFANPAGQQQQQQPQQQQQQQFSQQNMAAPDTESAANFMDQPATPNGYATNLEVHTFGELARQLGMDPLVLINFVVDNRARIDGAVAGPGSYLVGPGVALEDLVQAAGGTTNWADQSGVELLTTLVDTRTGRAVSQRQSMPLHQGMLASYIVRPHDHFRFNRVFSDAGLGSVAVQGEVKFTGNYPIIRGEHLSDLLMRAGGLTSTAYPAGTVYLRKSAAASEHAGYLRAADEIQQQLLVGMTRVGNDKIPAETFGAMQAFITRLRNQKAMGRVSFAADPAVLAANPERDPLLEAGDVIYIPQRPGTIAVLGEVMQPGSYAYQPNATLDDYLRKAGGYAQYANEGMTFVVLPDGSAHKLDRSWLRFSVDKLPPGSSIVVPRDLTPIDTRQIVLDVTSIMSSLAVSLASLVVISR
jgi:protein involved in polysaccharide export with SLBB domain